MGAAKGRKESGREYKKRRRRESACLAEGLLEEKVERSRMVWIQSAARENFWDVEALVGKGTVSMEIG